jgi:hypothetical protein
MDFVERAAAKGQRVLRKIVQNALCGPQQWDNLVDCSIRLPDGTVTGEMIAVADPRPLKRRQNGT